ncbi:protein translocase subunit SecDF [Arcticibacterium luteifluviistationis]|uniref:Multifunctional fusion protein n=1 Tax=Arcticibacterium luteifluviistationis TaxID=1784714 RepID=A0A2Z4GEQ6_9BACT|nr:protein translocase subunit SecDF [Arcticibacterium luteifluviistationis]AWV99621.1 protein translocase subunit SecDF [Arcticibacterium luteifluviistationis]
MRNRGGILTLVAIFLAVSVYYLVRTYKANSIRNDAEAAAMTADGNVDRQAKQRYLDSLWKQPVFLGTTLEDLTKQELGLGLDLQGGMHVILEVSPNDIVQSLASGSRDPRVAQAITSASEKAIKSSDHFVDLFVGDFKALAPNVPLARVFSTASNRGELGLNSTDSEVTNYVKDEVDGAFDRAFNIIQTRVDKFGVSNANLQRLSGTNRIQVELPGIDNPQRVRKLLSGAAKLEFCEVYEPQEIGTSLEAFSGYLAQLDLEEQTKNLGDLANSKPSVASTDTSSTDGDLASQLGGTDNAGLGADSLLSGNTFSSLFIGGQGGLMVRTKDSSRVNEILHRPVVRQLFPADLSFVYDVKAFMNETTNEELVNLYMVKDMGHAPLEGDVISNARQDYDPTTGQPDVSMQMNATGSRKWRELTAANVGQRVAILLDNYVYSAPNVNQEITGGNSSISGNFTLEEASDLANVLKAGKLPAPTHIIEEAVVGASVGESAVRAGVISSLAGLLAVLIFVLVYYNKAGWIANLALIVNLILLLGVMASFGATLTLPGIAGMVLSIGMAVDANVLIYERIKEELDEGKPFATAVRNGFRFAMPSIIDSNVTTLITGIILFIFGTGLVLGFATTLLIGIFTSLFCAIFISRLVFEYYIKKGKTVTFFTAWTEKMFKDTDIDFVNKRKIFYMISGAIIIAGAVSIGIRGFGLGVDFKGGRTYVAKFENSVKTEDVRQAMENAGFTAEVKTFGGFDQVKITTAYEIDNTDPNVELQIQEQINDVVESVDGNVGEVVSSSKVGPTIANDTIWNSLKAILYSLILTFIYIYVRFRSVAFSFGAVVAVFHDVLVILGIFSIFNGILPFSLDVDQAFVGAILTLMGYSMNDTVVVFDRVREYLNDKSKAKEDIVKVINNALNSTLSRTAVTGIATLLVLLILLIFGGETIRGFIFAMFLGVIVGTYSSLYIAAPIVVDAMQRQLMKEKDAGLKAAEVALTAKK